MIDVSLIVASAPQIYHGLLLSLQVTVFAFVIGMVLGSALGIVQARGPWWARAAVSIYATILRGTPMLVQISFIYFFLPVLGLSLSSLTSACLAIGLNSSAYLSQIIRAGIQSISADELEAAQILGFSRWQQIWDLILPQALRNTLPALTNESITLLKDSSLASVIGVSELYKELRGVLNHSYDVVTVFFMMGAIYLALTSLLALVAHLLERKFAYAHD